jgi:hypothetical protein
MELVELVKRTWPRAVYSSMMRGGGSERCQTWSLISAGNLGNAGNEAEGAGVGGGVTTISQRRKD